MRLEKAIEIVEELPHNLNEVLDHDQQDALKLLIEAGKYRLELEQTDPEIVLEPLPGETED